MNIHNPLPNHERDEPVYTPPGGPPQTDRIPAAVYEQMGEENITRFTHAFYTRLGQSSIAHMFPKSEKNLMRAADKSAAMFVFLFGGPHAYQQRYGQPMLRARHIPFVIDEPARQEWLRCYRETLDEASEKFNMPNEHIDAVWKFISDFSTWMVNAQTPGTPK
ncbi:MAG: hypothetical protein P1U42_10575 [Phycisphaerales bacterium]|nr:hypothetical protein [Phycisphaerales bacterium]